MNGKAKALAFTAMFLFATPAFAEDCATAIAELDKKLATANVSEEVLNEVLMMRMRADQMCKAGEEAEATETAQTAGQLLGGE